MRALWRRWRRRHWYSDTEQYAPVDSRVWIGPPPVSARWWDVGYVSEGGGSGGRASVALLPDDLRLLPNGAILMETEGNPPHAVLIGPPGHYRSRSTGQWVKSTPPPIPRSTYQPYDTSADAAISAATTAAMTAAMSVTIL